MLTAARKRRDFPSMNTSKYTKKLALCFAATALVIGAFGCAQDKTVRNGDTCAAQWQPLFNADLSNAIYDKSVWSVGKDGVMRATKDDIIFTDRDYQNFELELEFRIVAKSNSGVVIYCTDAKDWIPNSIEIQIADSSCKEFGRPRHNCASIFGHVDSEFDTRLPFGQWQKMKIRAVGQQIDVWLNGRHASTMDMSQWTDNKLTPKGEKIPSWLTKHKKCEMPTVGKIGLQGKHGNAETDFRNVKIRLLDCPKAAAK